MRDSPESPERRLVVQRWTRKADADLRTAEHVLTLGEMCPFEIVAFHAQQCVEKYLKALLVAHDLDVPKTHDVRRLAHLLADQGVLLDGIDVMALNDLTGYAVDARYPDDDEEPLNRAMAEAAVCLATSIRTAVQAALLEKDRHVLRLL